MSNYPEKRQSAEELTMVTGYTRRGLKRKTMLLFLIIIASIHILLSPKSSTKADPAATIPPAELDFSVSGQGVRRFAKRGMWKHSTDE